jgi:hypothetical protein
MHHGIGRPTARKTHRFRAIFQHCLKPLASSPSEESVMFRICLCLLIVVASSTSAAREIKLSSANSGSCPESIALEREAARPEARAAAAPARTTKAKPALHSDAAGSSNARIQSPRWHSFLPGMFR